MHFWRIVECRRNLLQNAEGIVERSFSFVQDVHAGTSENDGTGFSHGTSRELYDLVFSDHDLLNQVTVSQLEVFRVVKRRCDFASSHQSQSLDS